MLIPPVRMRRRPALQSIEKPFKDQRATADLEGLVELYLQNGAIQVVLGLGQNHGLQLHLEHRSLIATTHM